MEASRTRACCVRFHFLLAAQTHNGFHIHALVAIVHGLNGQRRHEGTHPLLLLLLLLLLLQDACLLCLRLLQKDTRQQQHKTQQPQIRKQNNRYQPFR